MCDLYRSMTIDTAVVGLFFYILHKTWNINIADEKSLGEPHQVSISDQSERVKPAFWGKLVVSPASVFTCSV